MRFFPKGVGHDTQDQRHRRQMEERRGEDISDKTYNKKNQEERLCDYVMESIPLCGYVVGEGHYSRTLT